MTGSEAGKVVRIAAGRASNPFRQAMLLRGNRICEVCWDTGFRCDATTKNRPAPCSCATGARAEAESVALQLAAAVAPAGQLIQLVGPGSGNCALPPELMTLWPPATASGPERPADFGEAPPPVQMAPGRLGGRLRRVLRALANMVGR